MIVHSTRNGLDNSCSVQVEGLTGLPEPLVLIFAMGAAAAHNRGYHVHSPRLAQWLDDNGRPLLPGTDTSDATAARVDCFLDEAGQVPS